MSPVQRATESADAREITCRIQGTGSFAFASVTTYGMSIVSVEVYDSGSGKVRYYMSILSVLFDLWQSLKGYSLLIIECIGMCDRLSVEHPYQGATDRNLRT